MNAKKAPKKATAKKSAKRAPAKKRFLELVYDVFEKAQFGKSFDPELLDVLDRLNVAEQFAAMDFEAQEPDEITRDIWNRETALADVQAIRDEFWSVKDRISAERAGENVFEIIAEHSARITGLGDSYKANNPEEAIVASTAATIYKATGKVPFPSLVAELIDALKAMAPFFDEGTTAKERARLRTSEETKAVRSLIELWAKRRHPEKPEGMAGFYQMQMKSLAKCIYDGKLFSRRKKDPKLRLDKYMKTNGAKRLLALLESSGDSSRTFFGQ